MSHNLVMDTAAKAKDGRPMFKNTKALFAACKTLGIEEPKKVLRDFPGMGKRECHEFKFPRRVLDTSHWISEVVVDVETGADFFDNYSPYTPQHIDVREGRKRAGEDGKWGHIARLWELDAEYFAESTKQVIAELQAEAALQGQPISDHTTANGGRLQTLIIGHPAEKLGAILQ